MRDSRPIGLIAGAGRLPGEAVDCLAAEGRATTLFAFDGISDAELPEDACWTRLGELERLCDLLRAARVEELLIVGKFDRSILLAGADRLAPDAQAVALLAKIGEQTDDGFMAAIASWFVGRGFSLCRQDLLLTSLLAEQGTLTAKAPDEQMRTDIEIGIKAVAALGSEGSGQAVAIKAGRVVAKEASDGTDEMIERAAKLAGSDITVVKGIRPGQDRRLDLPAIGVGTIEALARVSARGVAVEAGSTLLISGDAIRRVADANGLAVFGWSNRQRPGFSATRSG